MTEAEFAEKLHKVLSPSQPIRTPELLKGRAEQLDRIRRSLYAAGRHVFIYGERGVGKSSLAATAASEYQSSDALPIQVNCAYESTFSGIITSIAKSSAGGLPKQRDVKQRMMVGGKFLGAEKETFVRDGIENKINDIQDAVSLLQETLGRDSAMPVAVIDEFDRISSSTERNRFAELLKALGDQGSKVKLIFTGVANSIDSLLSAHESAYRQLETIHLERLPYQARIDIFSYASSSLNFKFESGIAYRIADICNGFPYFVHLLAEHAFWSAFYDGEVEIGKDHLHKAFASAATAVNAQLRIPYEKATNARDDHVSWVLWAVADAYDLDRSIDRIYKSYSEVIKDMRDGGIIDVDPLSREKVVDILQRLKTKSYGSILSGVEGRKGLYRYAESMVRGYVRLEAAKYGVGLHDYDPDPPPQVTASAPRSNSRKRWIDPSRFSLGYRRR